MKTPTHQIVSIKPSDDFGHKNWLKVLGKIGIHSENEYGKHLLDQLTLFFKDKLPLTLLLEMNYTDRDFRSIYYRHYSRIFRDIDRQSVRCHIFQGELKPKDIWPPSRSIENSKNYEGYFCVSIFDRPLLGRTILRYEKDSRDFLCSTDFDARVLGCKLSVRGFPFIWQDGQLIRCAQASLWMIHRYFSTRYPNYREALPHEILWGDDTPWKRLIPSSGLNVTELGTILSKYGYHPEVLDKKAIPDIFNHLHCYIESRIPVIACSDRLNHAVVAIGVRAPDPKAIIEPELINVKGGSQKIKCCDAADFCNGIIVNDDNYFPYSVWERRDVKDLNDKTDRTINDINYVIVPLYEKIFVSAGLAKDFGKAILFESPEFGLFDISEKPEGKLIKDLTLSQESFILRTVLTSSRTYLRHLANTLPEVAAAQFLRHLNLPKFVWLIELSTQSLYFKNCKIPETNDQQTGLKIAEVLIDATECTGYRTAWLLIRYPGIIMLNETLSSEGRVIKAQIPKELDSFPEPLFVNSP